MSGPATVALLTTFEFPGFDRAAVIDRFETAADIYRLVPGLLHKSFWIDESAGEVGGFYLFRDRASLEAFLASERWRVKIPQAWGITPSYRVFEVPVVVDNRAQVAVIG